MDDRLGSVLGGRYRLQEVLGDGGMARVYRATDTQTGDVVAVKIPQSSLLSQEELRARFDREIRAASRLEHPRIVRTLDWGQQGNVPFLVMELVTGSSLRERLQGEALPLEVALYYTGQILDALECAHQQGVVHRDISARNVMIDHGEVKVADFGIARALDDQTLTRTGEMIGSVYYMSPEQAHGEEAVPASDLYSVGVLLFEMVTGRRPFESDNPVRLAIQHVEEAPPKPSDFRSDLPARVEAVILKSLQKQPGQRFTTAGEMKQALEAPEESLEATRIRQIPAPTGQPSPGRKSAMLQVAVLVVLGLAATLLLVSRLLPSGQPSAPAPPAPSPVAPETVLPTARPAPEPPSPVVPPPPETLVEVPDLTMIPVETARLRLEQAGLEVGLTEESTESGQPPGLVLSQAPAPGTAATKGAAVDLKVSR